LFPVIGFPHLLTHFLTDKTAIQRAHGFHIHSPSSPFAAACATFPHLALSSAWRWRQQVCQKRCCHLPSRVASHPRRQRS
jgi:hypothetical protein